jgi:hypothetical protein
MRARVRRAALGLLLGAFLAAAPAAAQIPKVTFSASVSSPQFGLEEEVQLTFRIGIAGGGRVERFVAPPLREFEVRDTAQQHRMEISMGGVGVQHLRVEERIYLLKARKVGTFTIGEAVVQVAGREWRSRPLSVKVVAAAAGAPPAPAPAARPGLPGFPGMPMFPGMRPGMRPAPPGDDDLLLRAVADKQRVYLGEQLTASWYVYTQSAIEKYRPLKEPKIEAFWSEDLYVPTARLRYERTTHQGQDYLQALLLRKALFPLQTGKHTIGALESEFVTQASLFVAPTGSTRRSQALPIEVMPLPTAGQPPGFDPANVGRYELAASVDRNQVAAGEAVTLRLTIKGRGNLRQLKVPTLKGLEGFKVYQPKVQDQIELGDVIQGVKTVEYLLVPQRGGELTIPPVVLPCFDPESGRYVSLKSEALKVAVVGEAPRAAATQATAGPAENVLLPSIALIRNRHSVSTRVDRVLVRPAALAALLAVPPVALVALVGVEWLRQLLRRETARSRLRRARSGARRRLKVAEALIRSGSEQVAPAFFGELQRALYEHLEVVLGSPATGLTLAELQPFLVQRGVAEETARAVISELENCDFARFAPAAQGRDEMRAAVKRVRELLLAIERTPKAPEVAA